MHIHYLQHVAFEDAANIAAWAHERGHRLTHTRLDLDQPLPGPEDLDWLVVMGGPMNVDQHDLHPWLVREKQFIRQVIDRGVPVLGVCLGGQLISTVLGGQVTKNRQKEIGWFPVTLTPEAAASPFFRVFRNRFRPFIGTATLSRYRPARSAWPPAMAAITRPSSTAGMSWPCSSIGTIRSRAWRR